VNCRNLHNVSGIFGWTVASSSHQCAVFFSFWSTELRQGVVCPEDGGYGLLRNIGNHLQDCMFLIVSMYQIVQNCMYIWTSIPLKLSTCLAPRFAAEWLAFHLRIRWVQGSNLGPKTDYLDWDFCAFFSVPAGKYGDNTFKLATTISFHLISYSVFIRRCIAIATDIVT
jgi:hypothetical protein